MAEKKRGRIREFSGQHIRFRPPGPREDRLLRVPNLQLRTDELDAYTEIDPLQENIPPMRGTSKLIYPFVHRRKEGLVEIAPALPGFIRMEALRKRADRRLVSGARREPVDLGVAAFCEECLLCVAKCPAGAIPEKPLWWRGVYKREVNDLKCWAFFSNFKGCAVCINSCPFHRFGYDAVITHYRSTGEVPGREEILAEKARFGPDAERRAYRGAD